MFLYLSIQSVFWWAFNPFTFQVIIDMWVLIAILLFVFVVFFLPFLFCFLVVWCGFVTAKPQQELPLVQFLNSWIKNLDLATSPVTCNWCFYLFHLFTLYISFYITCHTDRSPDFVWYHQSSPVKVQMGFRSSGIDALEFEESSRGLQYTTQCELCYSLASPPLRPEWPLCYFSGVLLGQLPQSCHTCCSLCLEHPLPNILTRPCPLPPYDLCSTFTFLPPYLKS